METNVTFPKDGTIELATQELVEAITNNKLTDKEIEYLSKEFRHSFPQTEKYGRPTKITLENYSSETIENGIKKGLKCDSDLLLDMQNSGKIVPIPETYYTNDIDMEQYAKSYYADLKEGYLLPSETGILGNKDAQLFYHELLGNELYNSDKCKLLRSVGNDMDLATKEFFNIISDESILTKDNIIENFKEEIENDVKDDNFIYQDILDDSYEDAVSVFHSNGFLKETEAYLFIANNVNWKNESGCSLKDIKKFEDIINAVVPKADYTIDITHKENTPYFEAMVYSHDVPTGSHVYILPESQWDKLEGYDKESDDYGQGYTFLKEAIEKNELVREIFHSRKIEREMGKEAENNPVAKKMLEVYHKRCLYNYSTAELNNDPYHKADAWNFVGDYLAEKIVQGTKLAKNDFKKCEELLIKFNPTLITTPEEISKDFKNSCQLQIEYNEKIDKMRNKNQR